MDHKGRSHVAHPGVVMGHFDYPDRLGELVAGIFVMRPRDPHGHRLETGNGRGDRHKTLLSRLGP